MQLLILSTLLPLAIMGAPLPILAPRADTTFINMIAAGIGMLPGIGGTIMAVSGALTTFEVALSKVLSVDTTESDSASSCTAMMVIFARGTTEPGNVGLVTGPPFFKAIESMLGSNAVSVQGVEYPASIEGFLQGGDKAGSQLMANMITTTIKQCPNADVVMAGYSQGGQLVHNAAELLPASTMAKVSSVVIFGDPNNGKAVQGASAAQTLIVCDKADNICAHGDLILPAHLLYSKNAAQAASFVTTQAGLAMGASKYANGTTI